ncbi:MAG: integrase core domain-containing protein [Sulfuricaulis sp.]
MEGIKRSVLNAPISHRFVERLIGTIRREYLDQVLFWNPSDLERKLNEFKEYFNGYRVYTALYGKTPEQVNDDTRFTRAQLNQFAWLSHCRGLFHTPVVA